jgi:sulfopyruvate decarboxylase TPP-binding subunit
MRGEYAEFNPWQVPMGSITDACLRLCGFLVYRIEKAEDVAEVVAAACDISFDSNQLVAIILSQRLIGRKRWNN